MKCLKCGTEMIPYTEYSDEGYTEYPILIGEGYACPNTECEDYDDDIPKKGGGEDV